MRLRCFAISAALLVAVCGRAQTADPVVGLWEGVQYMLASEVTLGRCYEQLASGLNPSVDEIERQLKTYLSTISGNSTYTVTQLGYLREAAGRIEGILRQYPNYTTYLENLDDVRAALVDDFAYGYYDTNGDPHSLAEMLYVLWDDTWAIAAYFGGPGQAIIDPDGTYQIPQNVYHMNENIRLFVSYYGPSWVDAITGAISRLTLTGAISRLTLDGVAFSVTNAVHIDAQMLEDWELSGANYQTWDSFDALVDEYWDTTQFEHRLGYVTTNQWFEMNWWERVSCALFTLVSSDNKFTTPDTGTVQGDYDDMGEAIDAMTFHALDKGEAVRDNLSVLADEVGTFATYYDGTLTIIPLMEFPITDTYTFSVGPVQWDVRGSPCYPLVGAVRTGFLWLWQFIAAVGMLAFFISVAGGAVYFATWLIKCASDLKVYPFEWEKVFVSPFRFFHF